MDLRSLALFRIFIALVILADLYVRSTQMELFYTENGLLPLKYVFYDTFSIHTLSGELEFQQYLFWIAAFFAVALLLGIKTTFVLLISWFLMVSLHLRNPQVLNAGDRLLRLVIFISIFLPLGKRLSIDYMINSSYKKASNQYASIWTFIYHLQLSLLYIIAGFSKFNMTWLSGSGIYYALKIHTYAKSSAVLFLKFPLLAKVFNYFTLVLECFGWLLLMVRKNRSVYRLLVAGIFISFHFGLFLFMELGMFPWVAIVAWIPILPSAFWDYILSSKRGEYNNALPDTRWKPLVLKIAAGIYIVLMIYGNLVRIPHFPKLTYVHWFMKRTLLDQGWGLFAELEKSDGWYVAEAILKSGDTINLLHQGSKLNWDRPTLVSSEYKTHRERKYMRRLHQDHEGFSPLLLKYLAQKWNASHPTEEQIISSKLYYMKEDILLDNQYSEASKIEIGTYVMR